ncbi:cysteine desulfurase-like protein [bacterium]|nr:cysteine desulfurase-like protein [bacterium]
MFNDVKEISLSKRKENSPATLDLTWIRSQFPALALEVAGKPAVFFDGPGGTQVPRRVIDAISDYLIRSNANTHGGFLTARRTEEMLVEAHAAIADLLGCEAREVVFGANMTSLTFALSRSIGREIEPGDEIIVTQLDHDADVAPWRALEERGAVIRVADFHPEDCTLHLDHLYSLLSDRTKLVAVGYASNAAGSINDVQAITKAAHAAGALCFVDAVHYAPHGPLDVQAIGCDFLACSAYKFFGPHVGILWGKRESMRNLPAYQVRPAGDELPGRWLTGTQNHEGLAGTIAAIDYIAEIGGAGSRRASIIAAYEAIASYERTLTDRMLAGLRHLHAVYVKGELTLHRVNGQRYFLSWREELGLGRGKQGGGAAVEVP